MKAAQQAGCLAISFDLEGTNALRSDVDMDEAYHTLGFRQMSFAYKLSKEGCVAIFGVGSASI
ncbi:hypothetical protein GS636_20735 [Ruegeria sp. HKCCD4884]|nr:hypothetical protein [Ruegeria sp. HKCCD4884]